MNLAQILDQINAGTVTHRINVPGNWLQGRTCYGGLSSAMAYKAATISEADLPPLKSAQVAFSGPLSGDVEISTKILRRGKNSAFIRADIASGDETGLSCMFQFMNDRSSSITHQSADRSDLPPLPDETKLRSGPPHVFTSNLEYGHSRSAFLTGEPRVSGWHRFAQRNGLDTVAELICMSDALPPAAFGMTDGKANFSSVTWQTNIISQQPQTQDGWWYLETQADHILDGSSSQKMGMWNSEGKAVMSGMQSVAIFG